jgi:hypothetical protein
MRDEGELEAVVLVDSRGFSASEMFGCSTFSLPKDALGRAKVFPPLG